MAFVVPSWGGDSGGDYGFGGGGEGEAAAPKAAGGKKGAVGDAHVRRLAEVVRRLGTGALLPRFYRFTLIPYFCFLVPGCH